jgi:hypothetical protein
VGTADDTRVGTLGTVAQWAFLTGLGGMAVLFGIWASTVSLVGGHEPSTPGQVCAYDVVLVVTVVALLLSAVLASSSKWGALRVWSIVALLVLAGETYVLELPDGRWSDFRDSFTDLPADYVPCVTGGDDPRCT